MANLEVRIRHVGETVGAPLAEIPFRSEAIDSVIPLIKSWGLSYDGDGEAANAIVGQFAVYEGKAYFEVIVGAEE